VSLEFGLMKNPVTYLEKKYGKVLGTDINQQNAIKNYIKRDHSEEEINQIKSRIEANIKIKKIPLVLSTLPVIGITSLLTFVSTIFIAFGTLGSNILLKLPESSKDNPEQYEESMLDVVDFIGALFKEIILVFGVILLIVLLSFGFLHFRQEKIVRKQVVYSTLLSEITETETR
jgi:hypothetical protein